MGHSDDVYFQESAPIEDVARRVGDVLGETMRRTQHGTFYVDLTDESRVWLEEVDPLELEDLYGMNYELAVRYFSNEVDRYAIQESIARQLYERLVEATPWRLMLAFHDGEIEVARREPGVAAA